MEKFNIKSSDVKALIIGLLFPLIGVSCSSGGSEETIVEYIPVQLSEGGAWTFVNDKGEKIGDQQWDSEPTVTVNGLFAVKTDKGIDVYKWNDNKAETLDSLTDLLAVGEFREGLMPVTPPMKRIRVVDGKGKVKFELEPIDEKEISSCHYGFYDGALIVTTTDGKNGAIDRKGKVIVKPEYDAMSDFSDGYAFAAKYNYDSDSEGVEYFVLDQKGNATKVQGKFGYEEGESCGLPKFEHGSLIISSMDSEGDSDDYEDNVSYYKISTDGKSAKTDENYRQYLDNGSYIAYRYSSQQTDYIWYDAEGKEIMNKTSVYGTGNTSVYLTAYGKYVTESIDGKELILYNENGEKLNEFNGSFGITYPGGNFGPILSKYGEDYSKTSYQPMDPEGKLIGGVTFFGVGYQTFLTMSDVEGECMADLMSAYVDAGTLAAQVSQLIKGPLKGKMAYTLNMPVSEMLSTENYDFNGTYSSSISVPAKNRFLIEGPGYYSYGYAVPSSIYDPGATIESFDLQFYTNFASGSLLRDEIKKRLTGEGYALARSAANYDEYVKGDTEVLVYGTKKSNGVGVRFGRIYLSDEEKSNKGENF